MITQLILNNIITNCYNDKVSLIILSFLFYARLKSDACFVITRERYYELNSMLTYKDIGVY